MASLMPDDDGYVPLWRCIQYHEVFQDAELLKLFLWCLCRAAYKPQAVALQVGRGKTTVKLRSGQFIFGRNAAADRLCIAPSTLWDRMKRLEAMGCIAIDSDNQKSIVTVCNYDKWRIPARDSQQPTNRQPTAERQPTGTKKKGNNSENGKKLSDHIDFSLEEARIDLQKITRAIGRPERNDDRLLCIRAAILRQTAFNENWLCDSLAAVANVAPRPQAPFNYLRTCLATKAAGLPTNPSRDEKTQAVADLNERLRRVPIPADLENWPRDLRDSPRSTDAAVQNTLKPIGRLKAS